MRRALLLVFLCACEPEPELAVAPASLLDGVPVYDPEPDAGPMKPSDAEVRVAKLRKDITADNALDKARALEATLDQEIENLETRLKPVEIDMGGE
jgi:hypothetical protein